MALRRWVTISLLVASASFVLSLECRDESGAVVDWFVLYKLPIFSGSKDYLLRRGLAYMYITSRNPDADWKLSLISINDSRSIPGQTLKPLYSLSSSDVLQILYNDEPPSSSASLTYGHTKGVVLADEDSGIWMIHSVPKFPIEPTDPKTKEKNKYIYPSNGVRYGQSFLCISMPTNELNSVGTQLQFNKPKVYFSNVPSSFNLFPNMTEAARGKYVRQPPWTNKLTLTSLAGTRFSSYAKSSKFGKDLYSDWVGADLQDDLQVETWSNGAGELPSDCRSKFHVMDIIALAANVNATATIQFKNSQDHSKWAITLSANTSTVCVGDINRMAAQFKRGGGTICLKNSSLWKRYSKIVVDVQPCPNKN